MKLTRRRAVEEATPPPDGPPPPPAPPRGSPVAAYAGILDGHTLWLAVDATPGTLALRDASGTVHPLSSDLPEDDPAYRSVRADLLEIVARGEGDAAYDVVLVPPSGRGERPVWIAPFPAGPTRVPPTADGRRQLGLARTDEGFLRVRSGSPVAGLDVVDLAVDDAGIRITFATGDAPAAVELRLVDDDTVLARYPVTREGDRQVAVVSAAELPRGDGRFVRVLAGETPLRRRANDLANPNPAVLLPVLTGDDAETVVLRLRWSREGLLLARLVDQQDEDES